ncbi:MAG: hypothetical protein RLZZ179_1096 [Verrucomicrobiota bacterium]|jgi:non-specific serine/threonine protein kinase
MVSLPPSDRAVLRLTPEGELVWQGGAEEFPELAVAFRGSAADGLLALAGVAGEGVLTSELAWWRGLARRYVAAVCHLPGLREHGWTGGPAVPDFAGMVAAVPAAPGMEYVRPEVLRRIWEGMDDAMAARFRGAEEPASVLAAIHPAWRMVGRVALHLAENRQNRELPFAFLATAVSGIDAAGREQHVPLGQALRDAADDGDSGSLRTLLEPLDRAAAASAWLRELVESRRVFQALAWSPAEAWQFLTEVPGMEEAGLVVRVPDWWSGKRSKARVVAQVAVESEGRRSGVGGDSLLRFDVRVAAGGEVLSEAELEKLLQSEAPLVSLKGRWVEVDRDRLRDALQRWRRAAAASAQGIPFHVGMRMLSGLGWQAAGIPEAAGDGWVETVAGEEFGETLAVLRHLRETPDEALPEIPGLRAVLRSYQQAGVAWLRRLTSVGAGACLADDMGLGKTVQVIAWLLLREQERAEDAAEQPSLLVAPASLLGNWTRELEKFAPELPWTVAHRSAMTAAEWSAFGAGRHSALERRGLILTTYTAVSRMLGVLSRVSWDAVILDEAQAVKNAGTAQSGAVRGLHASCRVALTGTPVENRLSDLWSLFDFLNPGLLGTAPEFDALVKRLEKGDDGLAPLRSLVQPFLLRRMKTDPGIAPELPAKTEMAAICLLSRRQAILYQRAINALGRELAAAGDPVERQGAVLGSLLRLKQICNHPSLFSGDAVFAPGDSGKFERLGELAREIHGRGERFLVFSQFREMTGPLAEFLAGICGRAGLVLHGAVPVRERQALVERFQAADGPPFFVISVKAGGTGLTLTRATHVIHFDRWWNPAVEDQATDRAYRIGQTSPVMVHKFLCRGTLEERIDRMIRDKKQLSAEMLAGGDGAAGLLIGMGDEELLRMVGLDEDAAVDD